MAKLLTKFWFETEKGLGIGVTAYDLSDAIKMLQYSPQAMRYTPNFNNYKTDIKIEELDQKHVVPNMGIIVVRGIWYPIL